jgi:hypothetical protein
MADSSYSDLLLSGYTSDIFGPGYSGIFYEDDILPLLLRTFIQKLIAGTTSDQDKWSKCKSCILRGRATASRILSSKRKPYFLRQCYIITPTSKKWQDILIDSHIF